MAIGLFNPALTIEKIISGGQTGAVFRFSGLDDYVWRQGRHLIAAHDLTNAYLTDETLCNVEVLIEHEGMPPKPGNVAASVSRIAVSVGDGA
jgi:hypothetical protein